MLPANGSASAPGSFFVHCHWIQHCGNRGITVMSYHAGHLHKQPLCLTHGQFYRLRYVFYFKPLNLRQKKHLITSGMSTQCVKSRPWEWRTETTLSHSSFPQAWMLPTSERTSILFDSQCDWGCKPKPTGKTEKQEGRMVEFRRHLCSCLRVTQISSISAASDFYSEKAAVLHIGSSQTWNSPW